MTTDEIEALADMVRNATVAALTADPGSVTFVRDVMEIPDVSNPAWVARLPLGMTITIKTPAPEGKAP